jgi:hypothetical protein
MNGKPKHFKKEEVVSASCQLPAGRESKQEAISFLSAMQGSFAQTLAGNSY